MTVAERMRRDGWREIEPRRWVKSVSGIDCIVSGWFGGSWWVERDGEIIEASSLAMDFGVRDSSQRAKAAARKLARQRGRQ